MWLRLLRPLDDNQCDAGEGLRLVWGRAIAVRGAAAKQDRCRHGLQCSLDARRKGWVLLSMLLLLLLLLLLELLSRENHCCDDKARRCKLFAFGRSNLASWVAGLFYAATGASGRSASHRMARQGRGRRAPGFFPSPAARVRHTDWKSVKSFTAGMTNSSHFGCRSAYIHLAAKMPERCDRGGRRARLFAGSPGYWAACCCSCSCNFSR